MRNKEKMIDREKFGIFILLRDWMSLCVSFSELETELLLK